MKTYTKDELAAILEAHAKWLRSDGGSRADLSRANLSGANLGRADLSGAYLSGAYLGGAYLIGAVHRWAQVAFMGHGECGRMLTAVIYAEGGDTVYQCGCFSGSMDELKAYIANGPEAYKPSRNMAMEVVTQLLNA